MIYAIIAYVCWVGGLCIAGAIIDRIIKAYERRKDVTVRRYNNREE